MVDDEGIGFQSRGRLQDQGLQLNGFLDRLIEGAGGRAPPGGFHTSRVRYSLNSKLPDQVIRPGSNQAQAGSRQNIDGNLRAHVTNR
jgi:hypothetical protein